MDNLTRHFVYATIASVERGDNMDIKEASKRLGKSEKTVRRWIEIGKIQGRIVKGKYEIDNLEVLDAQTSKTKMSSMSNELVIELRNQITELRKRDELWARERSELLNELKESRQQIEDARERSDTIIMQLTKQLEQSQRMLGEHQEPWYRKLFKKKV